MPVDVDARDHVLRMTLNRPEQRNCLDLDMLEGLAVALARLADDDDVWVGLVTGTGQESFCAGADLKKLPGEVATLLASGGQLPATFLSGLELDKPVVAAINGDALGGGLELALGADLRIVADHALLGLPESRWSLVPAGGGTWRLPRVIGESRALSMMLTARPITAEVAVAWGLADQAVTADQLATATDATVDSLLAVGPLAARAIKALTRASRRRSLLEAVGAEQVALAELQASADVAEGLTAFFERRTPVWQGR